MINLSADKPKVIREGARVLRPGGQFGVSDVIADPGMDATTRADMAAWTACIDGALTETEFRSALRDAGYEDIEILETHRIHEPAAAAVIRARRPAANGCCQRAISMHSATSRPASPAAWCWCRCCAGTGKQRGHPLP